MISGHFATALVAKTQAPKGSIWLYLIAAQSLDILMISFVVLGIENLELGESIFPALGSATVDMRYSHDLLPVVGWTFGMGFIGYLISRSWAIAGWCAGLAVVHEICDLITGYPHNVMGPDTAEFGLHLWTTSPYLGTAIEVAVGFACVAWFLRHYRVGTGAKWVLYISLGAMPILLLPLVLQ